MTGHTPRVSCLSMVTLREHSGPVYSVAFSPDGKRLATGGKDRTCLLWDLRKGEPVATLRGHYDVIWDVAYSPDGRVVATASEDTTTRLWDGATGAKLEVFHGAKKAISSVAFSPDGKRLAAGCMDGTTTVWDTTTGRKLKSFKGSGSILCLAFSPDGATLAAGLRRTCVFWDCETGRKVNVLEGHGATVCSIAFSPDGRLTATAMYEKGVLVWYTRSGKVKLRLEGELLPALSVVFSRDGSSVATGSSAGTPALWNAATGELLHSLKTHAGKVLSVALDPKGLVLASACDDGAVRVGRFSGARPARPASGRPGGDEEQVGAKGRRAAQARKVGPDKRRDDASARRRAAAVRRRRTRKAGPAQPAAPLERGTVLRHYEILEKIGEGIVGPLFRAQSVLTDEQVALKVVGDVLASDERFIELLEREMPPVLQMEHDNIVRVLDADVANGRHYVAMQFVEGRSLGEVLAAKRTIKETTELVIAHQVARALDYAASLGLYHGGVRPSSIMLTAKGQTKLADFGLARALLTDLHVLKNLGPASAAHLYMSPEQASSAKVDVRSDIYGLGASLYHMVTGVVPVEAPDHVALMAKHLSEVPQPARRRNRAVSEAVSALIERMMVKEPSGRFRDPGEVIGAIESIHRPSKAFDTTISLLGMSHVAEGRARAERKGARSGAPPARRPARAAPDEESPVDGPAAPERATKKPGSSSEVIDDFVLAKVPVSDSCKRLGNITLVRKLGQGGMGAVYLGRHDLLETDVAVKVVLFHLMQDPRRSEAARQRFLREARLTARLDHPGIVRILEMNVDRDSDLTYIVMEYVNGGSASDLIEKLREIGHKLSEVRLLEIGAGAAEALQAAHQAGIVHRDVKPGNLLIRKPEWTVKLADLGLAKCTADEDSLTVSRSGAAIGTPSYMPPEQFSDSKHVGPAVDIYGLGATLYHLATGTVPFQADSIFALINKIVTEPARPPRELRDDLSAHTESVLQRAMMKRPEERYGSAEEMAADLKNALASLA